MYDRVTLLYSRNWPNIVNQLFFNLKKKENYLKVIANFLLETMQARRQWRNIFEILKENLMSPEKIPLKK